MAYQGKGGMGAWAELIFYIYDLKPEQIEGLLSLAMKNLKKGEPVSEGRLALENLLSNLSEDKIWFWSSLIHAAEDIKPSYSIRKNKK